MRKLKILLGDNSYFNRYSQNVLFTPLAVGYVATYAKQLFGREVDIKILKKPELFLNYALENKPDLIGLSLFYWNTNLNHFLIKKIRQTLKENPVIVYGGPSIDTDPLEQKKMFQRHPEVNALIPNEGELGFANIIRRILSDQQHLWNTPIDGVVYQENGELVAGAPVGLSLDITTLDSPYLMGLLDDYLDGCYKPLLQTSRLCPYSCSFCVSGKTKGKLRAFSMAQVKEEISFISRAFKNSPHLTLQIADENFGILHRDIEVAEHIKKCSEDLNYPKNVFFYNDKRFTETSHKVIEALGHINNMGLALSLQTENPETLKAIKRTNLTSEQIDTAITWAAQRNISTTTELIFGLPHETKDSFVDLLERCVKRGFDSILCYNVFVMDGIEMNRSAYREKHNMQTMYRGLSSSYGMFDNEFLAETEEIVTTTKYFNQEDFFYIRDLSFMYFCVFSLGFYRWFFFYLKHCNISLSEVFYKFLNPDLNQPWPQDYLRFTFELKKAFNEELFPTKELLHKHLRKIYEENNNEACSTSRINVRFGSRLIYCETSWMNDVLKKVFNQFCKLNPDTEKYQVIDFLLNICDAERVNLKDIEDSKAVISLKTKYDILKWRAGRYKENLTDLKTLTSVCEFKLDSDTKDKIKKFNEKFSKEKSEDYYYCAFGFIDPYNSLLYNIHYVDQ